MDLENAENDASIPRMVSGYFLPSIMAPFSIIFRDAMAAPTLDWSHLCMKSIAANVSPCYLVVY